ncbi:hypothetical protein DFH08DRAFT_1014117 [Mycena albidolilacea]|uniref:Uncharacterized protein n=1 Tax=Mycena albidolilacea TaxID=1033008 RepID=A0AAD6ZV29_9AGAR|nr:hypothetical protein DFH08DRAFT_1014117 [Mycena albidolilacea]
MHPQRLRVVFQRLPPTAPRRLFESAALATRNSRARQLHTLSVDVSIDGYARMDVRLQSVADAYSFPPPPQALAFVLNASTPTASPDYLRVAAAVAGQAEELIDVSDVFAQEMPLLASRLAGKGPLRILRFRAAERAAPQEWVHEFCGRAPERLRCNRRARGRRDRYYTARQGRRPPTSMDLSVETSCLTAARPHLVDPLRPSPALLHPSATDPGTAVVFLHTNPSALRALDPQKLDSDPLQGASRVCLTPARNAVAEGAALPECTGRIARGEWRGARAVLVVQRGRSRETSMRSILSETPRKRLAHHLIHQHRDGGGGRFLAGGLPR